MLRAVGSATAFRPQIGCIDVVNLTPSTCTLPIWRATQRQVPARPAAGVIFSTITVSDGISMGSPGIRYSLMSREVIITQIK
jgi:dihydroxy-acid dehydratase